MDANSFPGISFSDLIGEGQEMLSMERVESLLGKISNKITGAANISPNQLVRVMHNGKVIWMTQKQAADYAAQPPDENKLQKDVLRALKGELNIIRQELEILLALARYTLNHFKENEAISKEEIERIEPALKRRQSEINEGISQTAESESVLRQKRRRNPLLDEYEDLMGEFINVKTTGNREIAMNLAKQLASKKRQYLLLTRAIEPDVRTINYHRLNLQKTKKRILNTQNDLCSTRKDFLQIEIKELQRNLQVVKDETDVAASDGEISASAEIGRLSAFDEDMAQAQLEEKTMELTSLEQETAVLNKQESEVDTLISHISENVLNEVESKLSMDQVKSNAPKITQSSRSSDTPKPKKTSSGMHIHRDR